MNLPAAPFAPVALLFMTVVESDLLTFLREAPGFVVQFPVLVDLVEADLDEHARRKKALRVADKKWVARRAYSLPGMEMESIEVDARKLGSPNA